VTCATLWDAVSTVESDPIESRAALVRRAVVLLARDPPAPLAEVDALLTDACAATLALAAEPERHPDQLELLRDLIGELTARRRAHERNAQASPHRTA
jgi:hypothetical protein